jgi:hypothetical protein
MLLKKEDLTRLAVAGLLAGSMLFVGCGEKKAPKDDGNGDGNGGTAEGTGAAESKYQDVHGCSGLNVCKGLGGCGVTAEQLEKMANEAGIPIEKAGEPHDCAGMNACKGLGGCKVTAEQFKELKAKQDG